ncbi:MAG: sulfurtransferase TusA family protein [Thermofilum sp.]
MSEEIRVDRVLDTSGLSCPMPVVKTAKEIGQVPVGGILKVIATDPGSLSDIPAWAKSQGHEVVKVEKESGRFVFYVKRTK